jgi:hypothetical protein
MLVLRLNTDGGLVDADAFGGPGDDLALGGMVAGDGSGDIIIVGSVSDQAEVLAGQLLGVAASTDGVIARLDDQGSASWVSTSQVDGDARLSYALPPAAGMGGGGAGDIIIIGSYTGNMNGDVSSGGGPDGVIAFVDPATGTMGATHRLEADDFSPAGASSSSDGGGGAGDIIIVGTLTGDATPGGTLSASATGSSDVATWSVAADTGLTNWVNTMGGEGADEATAMASHPSGETRVVGSYWGDAEVADVLHSTIGERDAFIMSVATDGAMGDMFGIGADIGVQPDDLVVLPDGSTAALALRGGHLYLGPAGNTPPHDLVVSKWAADGALVYRKLFPRALGPKVNIAERSMDDSAGLAFAPNGDVFVCSNFNARVRIDDETLVAPNDSADAFVMRLDENGDTSWLQRITSEDDVRIFDCASTPEGDLIIVGEFEPAGSPEVAGLPLDGGGNDPNCLFARLSGEDGSAVWTKEIHGGARVACNAAAVASNGRIFIGLETNEHVILDGEDISHLQTLENAHLVAYDDDGTAPIYQWHRGFTQEGKQFLWDLATTSDDDVVALFEYEDRIALGGGTFYTESVHPVSENAAVGRFDGVSGEHMWSRNFSSTDYTQLTHVSVGPDDSVVAAGWLEGQVQFGWWSIATRTASS